MFESVPFWMYAVGFLLVLGPLVTVHELGHYLVGRFFGVHAEAFSVGFGKEIIGFNDRSGTRWKLSALPLGGYVQFKGDMNPASVPDGQVVHEPGSFQSAALWKRALIVAAGPVTNLVVAVAIFAAFFAILGKPVPVDPEGSTKVGGFSETSAAQEAGVEVGDQIIAIDGEPVANFGEILDKVAIYLDRDIAVTVLRDGEERTFEFRTNLVETKDKFGNINRIGQMGVSPAAGAYKFEPVGLGSSVVLAGEQTWRVFDLMVTGIKQVVTGERSIKELGGPVKIAKYSGEQLSSGPLAFFNFAALISLNLAFINFLPIPALDGGHLAFYAAEAIRRKPVGPRATEWAYRTGIALVLVFMVVVTFNDVTSLPLFGNLLDS
ncbi:RIP metalloprotease RseP [Erythrobacter sp. YT30]|uniref:RIP metalloprotease RseP n=1 Tax=Erythrobacter sp. YT30 TaxID=1735012 RepID=UPI00076D282D|nr:RIP metalloprotease RseP [Erythrobacter sp. YT30]KWV92665.1 RIP metalloprotease RseP [Erythrobacter sp. YT30]